MNRIDNKTVREEVGAPKPDFLLIAGPGTGADAVNLHSTLMKAGIPTFLIHEHDWMDTGSLTTVLESAFHLSPFPNRSQS